MKHMKPSATSVSDTYHGDSGQMVAELFTVIPAFLLVLIVACNLFMFVSIAAKSDRMGNEIVRELYQSNTNSYVSTQGIKKNALDYPWPSKVQVVCSVFGSPSTLVPSGREVQTGIIFYPFKMRYTQGKLPQTVLSIKRIKHSYIPAWFAGVLP
ncbi:MAG: hypothetical protein JJE36_03780 [Coriobacteriia bacterium]|nr:hypothetical protein [Coriobacteriia bacterium]